MEFTGRRLSVRGRVSGGIALFINEDICNFISILYFDSYLAILCLHQDVRDIYIIFLYLPTNSTNQKHSEIIVDYSEVITDILRSSNKQHDTILMGDLNGRVGLEDTAFLEALPRNSQDTSRNEEGAMVDSMLESLDLIIVNGRFPNDLRGEFTHFCNLGNSVIDYGAVSRSLLHRVANFETRKLPKAVSDHSVLRLTVRNKMVDENKSVGRILPFKFSATLKRLSEVDISQMSADDIANKLAGVATKSRAKSCGPLPNKAQNSIGSDKRMVKKLLAKPKSVWGLKKNSTEQITIPPDEFVGAWKGKYSGVSEELAIDWSHPVYEPYGDLLDLITSEEVSGCLSACNSASSPGQDGVGYALMKANSDDLIPMLCILYNKCLQDGSYPVSWKTSVLSPIFKKGDKEEANNYRPVSLQCCYAKLFAKIWDTRLREWLTIFAPLREEQFGFRPGVSTTEAIAALHLAITSKLAANRSVFIAFIDFSSAFDMVNHRLLMAKLRLRGLPIILVALIQVMYKGMTAKVRVGARRSDHHINLNSGVRQGDPLSPLLFSLFIEDLIQELDRSPLGGVKLNGRVLKTVLYADDVALIANSTEELQTLLDLTKIWTKRNQMQINVKKTKAMRFSKNRKKGNIDVNLFLDGEEIEWVEEFCYLGVVLEPNLLYKKQLKIALSKLKRAQGCIPQQFDNFKLLPIPLIRTVYNAVAIGNFIHGAGVWGVFSGLGFGEEENNRFIKAIFHLPKSTSHLLIEREMDLMSPKIAKMGQIIGLFIKLTNTHTGLLFDCITEVNRYPREPRNLLTKAKAQLEKMGVGDLLGIQTSAQHLSLILKRQMDQRHQTDLLRRIGNNYTGHELLQRHRPRDAASLYFGHLEYNNARTLLLVRCNSLFKPTQYIWPNICPLCSFRVDTDNGWEVVKHFVLDCHITSTMFEPFRSFQTNNLDTVLALINLDDQNILNLGIEDPVGLLKHTLCSLEDVLFFINTNLQ